MRGRTPALEQRFFDIFHDYYDLERTSARRYTDTEYTLARMHPVAAAAGSPEHFLRIVHVAGTKGKGSTCHLISALLRSAGHRCGMFTSPHLATVRERFQIDNRPVSYARLLEVSREFEHTLRREGLQPSLFEIMTVLSLRLFADLGCEFAVMETGIGGRLDATNYVTNPECCAITAVSLDHTQLLGETVPAIASEKAGIIKRGVPVVIGSQPFSEADAVIAARAEALCAPVFRPLPRACAAPFIRARVAPFLRDNMGTALAVCEALGIRPQPDRFELPEFRARCEVVRRAPLVILDAAHNADSARRLVEAVRELFPDERFTIVLGVVKGKDVAGIVRELSALRPQLVLTNPDTPKGSELERLVQEAEKAGLCYRIVPNLRRRDQLPQGENLLFTGSFFTAVIGERLFTPA